MRADQGVRLIRAIGLFVLGATLLALVVGMNDEKGKQITYHLPAKYWNEVCEFANILEKAPEFDGHTSDDVYERLFKL